MTARATSIRCGCLLVVWDLVDEVRAKQFNEALDVIW